MDNKIKGPEKGQDPETDRDHQVIEDIIDNMTSAGDELKKAWEKNHDLKTIQRSINAYGTAISAAKVLLLYRQQTRQTYKVDFFEPKQGRSL